MSGPKGERQQRTSSFCPVDLPEGLLTSILKLLPFKDKCQSQAVCRTFRDLLCNPMKGSHVWDPIVLEHPVLESAHPAHLARWLIRRVHGIKLLHYTPGYPSQYPQQDDTPPEMQYKHKMLVAILPQLPGLLSKDAELQLDLRFAYAELLLGSQEPTLSYRNDFVEPYWASLASTLTTLKLRYSQDIGHATTCALNQLARLQDLSLDGISSITTPDRMSAEVHLSLPQLQTLSISEFAHVKVALSCPQLKDLKLIGLHPLEALEGIPQGIERVSLQSLAEASLSLAEISGGQMLEQLTHLDTGGVLGQTHENPADLGVFKQVFRICRLTSLRTGCPLEKLTPLDGPQCALPNSLQSLTLYLPLERGIPVVLEQLTHLRTFVVHHTSEALKHLDRPLDPFLDMPHLEILSLEGRSVSAGLFDSIPAWTPAASRLLGLASRRILEGGLLPNGRRLFLDY